MNAQPPDPNAGGANAGGADVGGGQEPQVGTTPQKREPGYAAWVVTAGLASIVAIFVVAALTYGKASDVATATAGVSGVIAALVGAYFGVRGSSLAQKQAKGP